MSGYVVDSVGNTGDAWWTYNYYDVTFEFLLGDPDRGFLPSLPTHAGIVWTDGYGPIKFEAFDSVGTSLGYFVAHLGDGEDNGQTDEDRFLGVSYLGGISKIMISVERTPTSIGMMELDHLQYGFAVVPLPGGLLLGILGLGYAGTKLRRAS